MPFSSTWRNSTIKATPLAARTFRSKLRSTSGCSSKCQVRVQHRAKVCHSISITYPILTVAVNWFKHYHPSKNEDALDRYVKETVRCYDVLDKQIGSSGQYICCDKFTITDAAFYPWAVTSAGYAGVPLPKNVQRWCDHIGSLKDVKTAMTKLEEAAK